MNAIRQSANGQYSGGRYSGGHGPNFLWSLPGHGGGSHAGAAGASGGVDFNYLREIALAADRLGYFGVMLPADRGCEESWVIASAIATWTKRLRYLVAVSPGLQSPAAAARMAAALDRMSNGRLLVNVVTGDAAENRSDRSISGRDSMTSEFLDVYGDLLAGKPRPPLYFDGASNAGIDVAAGTADKYLIAGAPPDRIAERIARVKAAAGKRGRTLSFGIRLHAIVRETHDAAWDAVGQHQPARQHGSRRDGLEIIPNPPAGDGPLHAGTALVGDPASVAARIRDYQAAGIDTFVLSGYPHLEEVHRFAELVFPLLSVRRHALAAPLHAHRGRFDEAATGHFRLSQKAS